MKTRTKRSLNAATALILGTTALIGCGSSGSSGGSAGKSKEIYVISCTEQVPFCGKYASTLRDAFGKAGYKVTVLTDAFDPAKQNQHMQQAITAKPAAIILNASDATAIVQAVNRATAAGIPVINTDAPLDSGAKVTFNVLADHLAIGKFAGQGIVEGLQAEGMKSGNIFVAAGALATSSARDRLAGIKSVLAGHPQYKIVSVQDTSWDQGKAAQAAAQVFAQYESKGGIQAAYGMNDLLALGVVKAARQANLAVGVKKKGLVVVGGNCLAPGIPALKSDELYTSATQTPGPQAEAVAKHVLEYLAGKKQPKNITLPEYQITQKNVDQYAGECTF